MRLAIVMTFTSVLLACDATHEDDRDTEGQGEATEAASTTGITTTGPVTSVGGGTDDSSGPPPGTSCEACLSGWCGDELQACLADEACSCWLGCTETMTDEQCAAMCGEPGGPLVDLYGCVLQHCIEACTPSETTGASSESEGEGETGEESGTTGDAEDEDSTGGGAESTETTR